MTILIRILQFILSLSILVIIHELGHFVMAKYFKTRVEKFFLFFDPWFSVFKFRKGETEYGVGWLPLGGYVKISGMIDESLDKEQLKQPVQPYEFRAKKAWQRLMIMTGGVFFNFILALLIYVLVLYAWGETYLPTANVKYGIETDSTGHAMGLRNGDKILSVDNQYIENFMQITPDIILNNRKSIQVERNGEILNIPIPAEYVPKLLKGKGQIDARTPFSPFVISKFGKESPAETAGVKEGDELKGLDDRTFEYYDEFQEYLAQNRNKTVILNIVRNNEKLSIPVLTTAAGILGVVSNRSYSQFFELKTIRYGILQSIPAGISKGFKTIGDYLKQFKLIFSKHTKAYESLGGFITIGSIFPGVWDWQVFWNLTAFLSIILAVMNILPIPALDGGHVMFLLFEVITGKKPSDKFLEYAQIAGMIILFSLLIFANGNDILRLLRK
ncbi:MAG: RIP metalloprotease RseP [Bacteroidales bacterium]|jgi:regulator of sigma E protease|nr:RIP metalloprotease RseP [Bacteroidales bacterium]OQB62282.1 MAG: putative zinc metalloprotease [Bacteroidetes bacterium ADurb.Bin145]HOU02824.1 RIP metalloprotease RseP [Bacteroidales bacterium]HQK67797.1 RIP metalloprotease RseP [Bacteroidales bacterium]